MLPLYATEQQLVRTMGGSDTTDRWQLRRALKAASRSIDGARVGTGTVRRRLYPEIATRTFPIPMGPELDFAPYDLLSTTSIDSGGTTVSPSGLRFQPQDGPPYDSVCLNPVANSYWPGYGDWTLQLTWAGTWGFSLVDDLAGTNVGAINGSVTALTYAAPQAQVPVGVGSIVRCGTEYMIVTDITYVSSAVTLAADLGDTNADQLVNVGSAPNAAKFVAGDTIVIDGETLVVTDVVASSLQVQRGYNGSVPAAHTTGATLYAPRQLTVQRGQLGSSAASHADTDPLYVWEVPPLVNALCLAEAMNIMQNEDAAYGRAEGADQSGRTLSQTALQALREQVQAHIGGIEWAGV